MVGADQRRQRARAERAFRAVGVIRRGALALPGQFESRQHHHRRERERGHRGRCQHQRGSAPGIAPQREIGRQKQRQREERIQRRLKMPRQHHASRHRQQHRKAAQRAHRAEAGPQQQRQPRRGLEDPHVGTVAREKAGKREEDAGKHGRHAALEDLARQQVTARQGQQAVQRQLPLNGARRRSQQEERPVERIPGAGLRIGQKWKSGKRVGRPEGEPPGENMIGEVLLRAVVDVHRVPLNRSSGVEKRPGVEQQHRGGEGGQDDASRSELVPEGRSRGWCRRGGGRFPGAGFGRHERAILPSRPSRAVPNAAAPRARPTSPAQWRNPRPGCSACPRCIEPRRTRPAPAGPWARSCKDPRSPTAAGRYRPGSIPPRLPW